MSNQSIQDKLANIEAAIAAQEGLRGTLPDAQIDALLAPLRQKKAELSAQLDDAVGTSYQAEVKSGAAAQGDGALAVGERGVNVEGDAGGPIITGSGNVINLGQATGSAVQLPPALAPLRDKLAQYFNKGELKRLCFTLGVAHDDLPGDTRSELAQALVAYCHERGRLPELLRQCQAERPRVNWNQV